jgi:hypothetical protein
MRQWFLFVLATCVTCCSEQQRPDEEIDAQAQSAACTRSPCPSPARSTPGHAARETARRTALAAIQDLEPTATPMAVHGLAVRRVHFDNGDQVLVAYLPYRGTTRSGGPIVTEDTATDPSDRGVLKIDRGPLG